MRKHEERASGDNAIKDMVGMYLNFPFFISEEYSLSAFSRTNSFTSNLSISDCSGAGNCRMQLWRQNFKRALCAAMDIDYDHYGQWTYVCTFVDLYDSY